MSLNFDKIGRNIACIDGGKYAKKIISVYSGDEEDEITKSFSCLKIPSGKFQQMPDAEKEREILYITGPSGSGKSTYTANYVKEYLKIFKKNKVYIYSALTEDESLDIIPHKRIRIDDELITDPLSVEDFMSSLVIFDDIDVISNKKHKEVVYAMLNSILETGRHYKISCIITNHMPTAGNATKRALNECHSVTYFPHSGSLRALKYLLVEYLGLDKVAMAKIKKSKSRWATIYKLSLIHI